MPSNYSIFTIIHTILVALLVIFSLFTCIWYFSDTLITPKWYVYIIGTMLLALSVITVNTLKLSLDSLSLIFFILFLYLLCHAIYANVGVVEIIIVISWIMLFTFFKLQYVRSEVINSVIAFATSSQAVYGWFQYTGLSYNNSQIAISGSYDNPAGFAMCLAVGYPFILINIRSKKKVVKILGITGTVITLLALVVSESRTGIIGATIVSIVFVRHECMYLWIRKKKLVTWSVIFIGIIGCIVLFLAKKESALGRLNIWNITGGIITDHPFTGGGMDSFKMLYMPKQALYFETHPDNGYAQLADNVTHPFNEYLLLTCEYGFVGLLLSGGIFFLTIKYNKKFLTPQLLAVYVLLICGLFSYPFRYSFIWVVSCYALSELTINIPRIKYFNLRFNLLPKIGLSAIICTCLFFTIREATKEVRWKKLSQKSILNTHTTISLYNDLYKLWPNKPLFLYNYAAELHIVRKYEESLRIILECEKRYNDYDVQMIIAENYKNLRNWKQAEKRYKYALYMCPNKFMPLYNLMCIYQDNNDIERAVCTAKKIVNKPIKIPSTTISVIVTKAENYLNKSSVQINTPR